MRRCFGELNILGVVPHILGQCLKIRRSQQHRQRQLFHA